MSRYTARHLPRHQGPAAWSEILGPEPLRPCLEGDQTADFAIIGGGFAGLSAARRLTQLQPGTRIVVLEAGRIAEGASGRNSGFMIDLPHDLASDNYAGAGDDRALIDLNRRAIAFAAEAVEDYRINPAYFDPCGKVNGAASDAAHQRNLDFRNHLDGLGEASGLLDDQQMFELTGSRHYQSGLFTAGTVVLQPAGYIRSLANGLRGEVDIFEHSAVTEITRQGPDWQLKTAKGTLTTPRVLLTVNGHLESFGFQRGRLMQIFLFASMTPDLEPEALQLLGGQPRWGITPSDPMGSTVRRIDSAQGGNRIITRTCAALRPGMRATSRDLKRAARVHQRKFDQRFPALAELAMQYSWAGHLCLALNDVSVMGEIDDGLFAACVQNGLGTARGTLTGIGAAELACGKTSAITDHFTAQDPPKRLPPQPFASLGANAVMRWREWRARDE